MASKKLMEERKKSGLCIYCGNQRSDSSIQKCEECRERNKKNCAARRGRFKDAGLCTKCGKSKPEGNHVKCNECLDLQMKAYRRRLKSHETENKQCLDCGEPVVVDGIRCRICHVKRVSIKRTGAVKNWKVLDDKFDKQTGICPYTGRHLILGKDASLDHIVPSSKGGTNDLENLQWVFHKANEMKWNYSEEEFLGLVREIFLYRFGA